jgi:proton glutamate symport protein
MAISSEGTETDTPENTDTSQGRSRARRPSLGVQVLIGLCLGVVLGLVTPAVGEHLKIVGDAFIRLIQMAIIPLVFPLIVLSIAKMESAKALGRLAGKTILYFEVVTTAILILTMVLASLAGLGKGANLTSSATGDTSNIQKSLDLGQMFLGIIPNNVVGAFSQGNLLSVLFFAAFLGVALSRIGPKARPMIEVLDGLATAMFQIITWVVSLAPLAVVAFVAYNTAHYGWGLLLRLAVFVVVFYVAAIVVLLVVFPIVAAIFKVPYFPLVRSISDLILLAFVTRSAEVVLAPLIKRLHQFGVDQKVSSFTLPLGYSFNADGATMYEGLAVVFLAHAYGIELTVPKLVVAMLVLMLLTKGIAGVPSASIVVLFSAAATIGLPPQGIAILLAIDFVVDMARTAVNVTGNSLASMIIAKSEGQFVRREVESTAVPA